MSVPVTNEAYSQQNNQIFDWAKTATPQQIEVAKRGLPKDSPLLLAIGMGVQYQQQTRAPNPQAPQKTVMEQKLGEFTQASSQGLPQVGQNQMAMQQTAQQNPMFGAGLAVAPENTEQPQQAPAPQQMAATGGITALARGGEVRGFEVGGGANVLGGLASINLEGDPSSPYGQYEAPTLEADMVAPKAKVKPKVKAQHSKRDTAPAPGSSAEANENSPTAKGETYQSLDKYLSKGVVNPNAYDADSVVSNMLNSDTTPMLNQDEAYIARIQKLLGPEADMSEEVGMAREAAANASRDKGLGALVATGAGMLSAKTPYMGQAVGAGLMSGLSAYQQGAKEQGTADKELMALQMAEKKAKLAPRRAATEAYIGAQTKAATAAAEAAARMQEIHGKSLGDLTVAQQQGLSSANVAKINAASAQAKQILANMSEMDIARFLAGTLTAKDIAAAAGSGLRGGLEWKDIQATMEGILGMTGAGSNSTGASNPFAPVGNTGVFYNPKK